MFCFAATLSCPALGCEYKCRASPTGGACFCPEGRKIGNDSKTCIGELHAGPFTRVTVKRHQMGGPLWDNRFFLTRRRHKVFPKTYGANIVFMRSLAARYSATAFVADLHTFLGISRSRLGRVEGVGGGWALLRLVPGRKTVLQFQSFRTTRLFRVHV